MNKKNFLFLLLGICFITCLFFAKTIFKGQIPFPGDLLINTSPFKTQSFLGYAPGGYPNKDQGRDVITQSYPWRLLSVSEIQQGHLPLWDPYNFSGNALIGNYQSGVFYPFTIVFYILPFNTAWAIFIFLQPVLAMIFMYILLRDFKLTKMTSLIGSIAFAYSSYMVVWLEYGNIDHTFLWLPLMLFLVRKYMYTSKRKFLVFFAVAGACCLLAGYIQGAFYVFSTTFLYALFLSIHTKKRFTTALSITIGCIVAGLLASIQILPAVHAFIGSTRGNYSQAQIQNLLQPWYYPITIFASEFFGNPATRNFYLPITYFERVMYPGIPIVFFAMYGLNKVRNFEIKFFSILSVVILLITTNLPGISLLYALPIPVFSTTVPTRALSLFIFSVIMLGVFGIDHWLQKKELKSWVPFIFGGVYVGLWVCVLFLGKIYPSLVANLSISKHTLILSTGLAVATLVVFVGRIRFKTISIVLLAVLTIADVWYVFMKFTPFSPVALVFPSQDVISYLQTHEGIQRSWGYGTAYIPANYQTAYGIFAADGYDALHSKNYNELLNSSATGKVQLPLSRGDANIAPGYGVDDLKSNPFRQKMLNLLGVAYILNIREGNSATADNDTFPPEKYQLIWHSEPWQIYQNLEAFPRFFLANSYKVVSQQKEISKIYSTDLRKTILLSEKLPVSLSQNAKGSVTLQKYQPGSIILSTNSTGTQLLFMSDTYDLGWRAQIDGKMTPVYKADVAFRAIEVPKGKHTIQFFYLPNEFIIGAWITIGTIIAGLIYVLWKKEK